MSIARTLERLEQAASDIQIPCHSNIPTHAFRPQDKPFGNPRSGTRPQRPKSWTRWAPGNLLHHCNATNNSACHLDFLSAVYDDRGPDVTELRTQ